MRIENQGIRDVIRTYKTIVKQLRYAYLPVNSAARDMGFIKIDSITTIRGYFFLLAVNLMFIGFLNLFPIPGLDLGNSVLAAIENGRRRKFKIKTLKIIRLTCLIVIGGLLLLIIFIG